MGDKSQLERIIDLECAVKEILRRLDEVPENLIDVPFVESVVSAGRHKPYTIKPLGGKVG